MNAKYRIKPFTRTQTRKKKRTRRQRRSQREAAIAARMRLRRYKCGDCGNKVLLDARRKSSRVVRDHCDKCGSTFLQPDSEAAMKDFTRRGRGARTRAVGKKT